MLQEKITPEPLSSGLWDENISWEFFLAEQTPELSFCTAVCCFVLTDSKLLLVKNKRGWEIPAGHIESGENLNDAVIREVLEEGNVEISVPVFFGYKKLIAKQKVLKPGSDSEYYPFPISYVPFFYALITNFLYKQLSNDVKATRLVASEEALELLRISGQYPGIIEYLINNEVLG